MTAVLPATPAPGQIAVDSGAPCGAPGCGLPLDRHNGKPYHVNGVPVGNADCARALTAHRPTVTVPVRLCPCGAVKGECDCGETAASLADAIARESRGFPAIRVRFGAR